MTSAYHVREVCESHGEAVGTDLAMTLLSKTAAGLGFVLLGGLAAAHGGSAGQTWEVLVGQLLVM
jgi:hypothetical protein